MNKIYFFIIACFVVKFAYTQTAYITNYGSNSVSVIDISTNTVIETIAVGSNPHGVAVSRDGSKVYVTNYGSNSISVISTVTNTVTATIPVGDNPYGISISPDGNKLYVSHYALFISVINTINNVVSHTIESGNAYGIIVSPDGNTVYAAQGNGGINVINTSTDSITNVIGSGMTPYGVAISPDGEKLYVANYTSDNISVINTATNSISAYIPINYGPYALSISPDGSTLYVTNYGQNYISVVNTLSNDVITTIPVETNPSGISVSLDGSKVYVANKGSNSISVINTSTNSVMSTISVGTNPIAFGNFISFYPLDPPSVNISASFDTICPGTPTVLTAGGASTYLWSNNLGSNNTITVTPIETTTFIVTGISPAGFCTDSITITVDENLTVTMAPITNFININANAIPLNGTPVGGVFSGNGVSGSFFNPNVAGLGNKVITYNFNDVGCIGSDSQSIIVYDTTGVVCVEYDTIIVSVSDTLIINAVLTGLTYPNNTNILKIYPNPASTHIYINNGDYTLMNGYTITIENSLSQVVFTSLINQAEFYVDLSTWSGNGLYIVKIIDNSSNVIETKKIIIQ